MLLDRVAVGARPGCPVRDFGWRATRYHGLSHLLLTVALMRSSHLLRRQLVEVVIAVVVERVAGANSRLRQINGLDGRRLLVFAVLL